MDPFKDVWREDFEREVNEALGALDKTQGAPSAIGSLSESVIPRPETLRELDSSREKIGSLENTLSELRRRHELRSHQLEEELRRRDRLKDVIIRLNMSLRRLEREGEESIRKIAVREADTRSLSEQLGDSQEQCSALENALSAEKEQGLRDRLKCDELQARVESMLLRLDSKENTLKSLQARLDAGSSDSLRAQADQEERINALRRELSFKDTSLRQVNQRLEETETRLVREKSELELSTADLQRRLERAEEQFLRAEEALAKALHEESRLREKTHQDELEMQSMKSRLAAAVEAAEEAARKHEDLRRYEADLNARAIEKMKALREERAALLAETDAAGRQAQDMTEQSRAALERARRAEADAAHESALAHETIQEEARRIQESARRETEEIRRAADEARAQSRREVQSAQEHIRSVESEFARKESELLLALKADREALESRLKGSYERLRQEEAAARQFLEAEGSRLRSEAEAALREAQKIEEERAGFEVEKLKAIESEKKHLKSISDITLERARLEAALELSVQESRQLTLNLQSQQEVRAVLEKRVAELANALGGAERKLADQQHQPSAQRIELEEALRDKARLEQDASELNKRLSALSAAEISARQFEKARQTETDRLQAAQRQEIERLEGSLADAGTARARLETRFLDEGRALRQEMENQRISHQQEIREMEKALSEATAVRARLENYLAESGAAVARLEARLHEEGRTRQVEMDGLRSLYKREIEKLEKSLADMSAVVARHGPPPMRPNADPEGAQYGASAAPPPMPPHSASVKAGWRVRGALLAAVALAVLLSAGAGLYWREQNKIVSLRIPFSHPTALVWQGDTLWASDWYEEAVYRMKLVDGKLKVVRRYVLPGVHITGLAVGEGVIYLADSWKREIQRRLMDDSLSLESALPSPGPNPIGLFHDGKYLWTADGTGTIYQQLPDLTLSVLNSYPSNYPAVAIAADETHLWTADSKSRLIYARRRDNDLTLLGAFGLDSLDKGKEPFSCFARREGKLWVGRDGSSTILEAPWRRLEARPIPPHSSK